MCHVLGAMCQVSGARCLQLQMDWNFNYNFSIVLSGRAILEELILCIALAAGAIFSSILPALLGVYWKI